MATFRARVALGAFVLLQAPSEGLAESFPELVSQILRNQTEGLISELSDGTKTALISCVNDVLDGLPNGMKRFVMEGGDFAERERRFGKVVQDNHAEWKQKIARSCAKVALSDGNSGARTNIGPQIPN